MLEHIKNDLMAIEEIYRVLKSEGWLLLALPIYGEKTFELNNITKKERKLQYGIEDHMRLNGLDLGDKLKAVGFHVEIISTNSLSGNYFDCELQTPHSESDKYLFFCKKN